MFTGEQKENMFYHMMPYLAIKFSGEAKRHRQKPKMYICRDIQT